MILYKGKLGHWNLCLLWSQKSQIYLLLEASIPDHQWHIPECTSSSATCPILCGQGAPSKLLLALQPLLYLRCSCHQPCLPHVPWTSLISSPFSSSPLFLPGHSSGIQDPSHAHASSGTAEGGSGGSALGMEVLRSCAMRVPLASEATFLLLLLILVFFSGYCILSIFQEFPLPLGESFLT